MTDERAIRLARKWAFGGVCTLREGEAQEYHKRCLDALLSQLEKEKKNAPLTMDELRSRAGGWVWVVVNYEHCKCDGWALVPKPTFVAYLDQTIPIDFYGKKFVAYDHKPEED